MPHEFPASSYPTDIAKPTTPNETQDLAKEPRYHTWYKGALTGSEIYERLLPDKQTSALRIDGPSEGAFVLSSDGSVKIITGSRSKEAGSGSGKLCIHSHGQQQKHENRSDIQFNAGLDTEGQAVNILAYGDYVEQSIGGTRYIKAQKIVIEASEELMLIGKNQVTIQAGTAGGGSIAMVAGQIEKITNNEKEIILGQAMKFGVSEDTKVQFDPRASINSISMGHLNHKFLGDVKNYIAGVEQRIIGGKPGTPPLVKSRDAAYSLKTAIGGQKFDAADFIKRNAGAAIQDDAGGAFDITAGGAVLVDSVGSIDMTTGAAINMEAGAAIDMKAGAAVSIKAGAQVDITGAGDVTVKGAIIRLN